MKTSFLILFLSALTSLSVLAGPVLNLDTLGQQLGGWDKKGNRASEYDCSGSEYRTWKPEVSQTLEGGLFISIRIDHIRGLFASDDHASLQITIDKDGNVTSAQSSMAFQGKKITSDAIELSAEAGTQVLGVQQVTQVGTDLLADLSSKLLRENVAEPGRVTFPAVIHHNYNLVCLATGLLPKEKSSEEIAETEEQKPTPSSENTKPRQSSLKLHTTQETEENTGRAQPIR